MYHSKKLLSALAAIITAVPWGASLANPATASAPQQSGLFQNGDRWTAVGDSITHGGTYYAWIYLYYATRFPDRKIDFFNAGNSGDDAHGTLNRYDWDIKPHKSTVASIMLGMNDVRREIYGDMPMTNQLRDQRTYILEGYRSFMTKLVKRIQADGTRVILITPSIYDETAKNPQGGVLTGVNGALGECATFLRNLAGETGCSVIDFHNSMGALNAKIQAKDPAMSLIKPDRVHASPLGHFVMAYLFLKGQQAPAVVSSVSLDATGSKVLKIENATVEKLAARNNEVTFTLIEKALPYPVDKEQEPALAWVPFNDELNREMLKVRGLVPGEYQLSIDGEPVRRFKTEELETGVNLAVEKNTPQARQAAGVLELVKAWCKQVQEVRMVPTFEFWNLSDVPHPIALETVRARVEADMARVAEQFKDAPKEQYKVDNYARYLKNKSCEAEQIAKLGEMAEEIRAAARPQPHAYKLELVKP
ncbi:MAG: SGNH/GDSL hydrolase family protein [Verrucomicrobiae bacterium]